MGVQTLRPEACVERFDEGVVRGLARPGEVQGAAAAVSPKVQGPGDEL